MITINNDRIFNVIDKDTPILDAFKQIDEILKQGVQGISDLINYPGLINLDFANLKTILKNSGESIIGIGKAIGKDRGEKAAKSAIESPLLDLSIQGASRILFNISGQNDLTLSEITEAARIITDSAAKDAKIIFGASYDNELKNGEIKITVIAGGFNKDEKSPDKFVSNEEFITFIKKDKPEMFEEENINEKEIKINKQPAAFDDFEDIVNGTKKDEKEIDQSPKEEVVEEKNAK